MLTYGSLLFVYQSMTKVYHILDDHFKMFIFIQEGILFLDSM